MDLFPYRRMSDDWPDRVAWASFAVAVVGLLLLSLLIWVDSWEVSVEARAPAVSLPVRAEHVQTEPHRSSFALPWSLEPRSPLQDLGLRELDESTKSRATS